MDIAYLAWCSPVWEPKELPVWGEEEKDAEQLEESDN